MKCINHLGIDATVLCNHCGKSICQDCQVHEKGEIYCKDCFLIKGGQVKKKEHSPALAAILSFIIAGLGQIYNGQISKGLLIFFTGWLVVPWVIGIIDAYNSAKKINEGKLVVKTRPGCAVAFVVGALSFMMAVFILGLLAAIAIPNFLKAKMDADEAYAKNAVATISSAIESYRVVNNGSFPLNEKSLIDTKPAYLEREYNNKEINGYTFQLDFRTDGYRVLAIPKECDITGTKVFIMENGKKFSMNECRK